MIHSALITGPAAVLGGSVAAMLLFPGTHSPIQTDPIVITMEDCQVKRDYDTFFVASSKTMVRRGQLEVDGESFDLFLPKAKYPYAITSRNTPNKGSSLVSFTSTYLGVDQNHDGKLEKWESYYAEFPLRIGDSMFDVVEIAQDGSTVTLKPNAGPLKGAVIGRKAPDFEWTDVNGELVSLSDFEGEALLIDCWSPS